MKVILTMDVSELGSKGDQIEVASGYARNYLMPRRLAVTATEGNLRILNEESRLGDVRERKATKEAARIGTWLSEHELFATLKIGNEGRAFGAVTSKDIGILLRKAGLEVDRRRIQLDSPIKRLGVFDVPLAIHRDVDTNIRISIDREGGSPEGARAEQNVFDAEAEAAAEAARVEAEARAERAREAEEAARIAIEKAAARKLREEEEAKARAEAEAKSRVVEGGVDPNAEKDEAETDTETETAPTKAEAEAEAPTES